MTVKPRVVGPRLLVKPLDEEEMQTRSGLLLPEMEYRRDRRGVVVEVGEVAQDEVYRYGTPPFAAGDVVVWAAGRSWTRSTPLELRLDVAESGTLETFVVLHVGDVLLILEDAPTPTSSFPT